MVMGKKGSVGVVGKKKGCIGEGHAVPVRSENDSLDRRQSQ
jgi:hypothetical protein